MRTINNKEAHMFTQYLFAKYGLIHRFTIQPDLIELVYLNGLHSLFGVKYEQRNDNGKLGTGQFYFWNFVY